MFEQHKVGLQLPFVGAIVVAAFMFGSYGFWATAPLVATTIAFMFTALTLFRIWHFSDATGFRLVVTLGTVAAIGFVLMLGIPYIFTTAQTLL